MLDSGSSAGDQRRSEFRSSNFIFGSYTSFIACGLKNKINVNEQTEKNAYWIESVDFGLLGRSFIDSLKVLALNMVAIIRILKVSILI